LSFRNNADLNTSSVPIAHDAIIMLGYKDVYDMPPVVYKRWLNTPDLPALQTQPPHFAKLIDGDGRWWEMAPEGDHLDVRWFGAKLNGVKNDRLALEVAIACASPSQVPGGGYFRTRKVFIPEGTLKVVGSDIFVRSVTIEGSTTGASVISCQINGESLFRFDGGLALGVSLPGGGLRRLLITNGANFVGYAAVKLDGGQGLQPHESVFEDLKLTGAGPAQNESGPAGRWQLPFYLNGINNSGSKPGIRKVSLRNLFLGDPVDFGLYAGCVGDLVVENCGIYGGLPNSENVIISNSIIVTGTSGNKSNGVQMLGCDADSFLWVYFCVGLNYSGIAKDIRFSTDAIGCAFFGVQLNGGTTFPPVAGGNVVNAATW
jgi:hypothetical protein